MTRNVLTLFRGTVVAQAIGLLVLPLLSRLYDPSAFGLFQLYLSTLSILLVFPSIRLEIAILRAEDDEVRALLDLSLFALLGGAIVLMLGQFVWVAIDPVGAEKLIPFPVWLYPVSFVVAGMAQYLGALLVREQQFKSVVNSKIGQAVTYSAAASLIGWLTPFRLGLIVADIAGRAMNLLYVVLWMRPRPYSLFNRVNPAQLRATLFKYREYPLVAVPGGLINAIGTMLTSIMIYATFSAAEAGQYAMVDRAVGVPIALVVGAVAQVYTAELAREMRESASNMLQTFQRLVLVLAGLGIVPTLCLVLFAPYIFELVFGPQWHLAAEFAQILAPAYFAALVFGGSNMTLAVLGMQKTQMAWEAARLILMGTIWIVGPRIGLGLEALIAGHAAVIAAMCALHLVLCYFAIRRRDRLLSVI